MTLPTIANWTEFLLRIGAAVTGGIAVFVSWVASMCNKGVSEQKRDRAIVMVCLFSLLPAASSARDEVHEKLVELL